MAANRKEAGRSGRRAFRPTLDGGLEPRALLSALGTRGGVWVRGTAAPVVNQAVGQARNPLVFQQALLAQQGGRQQAHGYRFFTYCGGQGVRVIDPQGEVFNVQVIGTGTVRAQALPNGTVKFLVDGTTPTSELIVDPYAPGRRAQTTTTTLGRTGRGAHTFLPVLGRGDEILKVGGIDVSSGRIGLISGFRTVDLYGPINIVDSYANPDDGPSVNRIALNAMRPGSVIRVANDLETLDIFTSAELIGAGSGIFVNRDLNWMNVRGDLKLGDGGALATGRDLGLVAQPAKGSGAAGQGLLVEGDFLIDAESAMVIGRDVAGPIIVRGDFVGTSRVTVQGSVNAGVVVLGQTVLPPAPEVTATIPNP